MKTQTAQRITSNWHGGQWSALYQFSSSGKIDHTNILRYFQELENCLHPEYALHPGILSKKDSRELNGLKGYFLMEAKKLGFTIEFKEHSVYGYFIPYITAMPADFTKEKEIRNLLYMA